MFLPEELSFYIISLGCSKNQVDSEIVNGAMVSAGFAEAESAECADIIIINTCGFIEDAKRESIDVIFDALLLKENLSAAGGVCARPVGDGVSFARKIVVIGCLVSRYADELHAEIPEIDFLYGLVDDDFVPKLSHSMRIVRREGAACRKPLIANLAYSYIKIAEGCSNRCSYCAIPIIRGPFEAYGPGAILDDARRAVEGGARELIVIAQDIASYRSGGAGLPDLVNDISEIPGVEWIRLMYCHPDHIGEDIISLVRDNGKVVKYCDIPFQHASAKVLRAMNRKGDRETYTRLVERLRSEVPGIHLRSTFMVGFPGETDDDFEELAGFLRDCCLERVGCFVYSPEEGTAAASMGQQVPAKVKRQRFRKLMSMQKKISARALKRMVGSTVRVMVEERIDENTWMGRTEYDAPEVDGIFYLTVRDASANTIVVSKVTDALEYDLYGVPV